MRPDTALDYAVFQLSPKRSRCELYVSGDGNIEKIASGLLKPFVAHIKAAQEQVARQVPSIKLEVSRRKNNEGTWFTKGTLERFVRFVTTPDVLELVIKLDAEMSQLEAARRIYLQGAGNQNSTSTDGDEIGPSTSADITKKELLRAIDVRLVAVREDLTTACARASAAGFIIDTVSELQLFADRFGAHRLNEACAKFISLSQKRPDLVNPWRVRAENQAIRSSFESDMSIDDPSEENVNMEAIWSSQFQRQFEDQQTGQYTSQTQKASDSQPSKSEHANSSTTFPENATLRKPSSTTDEVKGTDGCIAQKDEVAMPDSSQMSRQARRMSVQDRINLFENKQKEQSTGSGGKVVIGKSVELRRLSSDVSSSGQAVEKAVLRRWSGASDMSMDLSSEKRDTDSPASTPCSASNSLNQTSIYPSASVAKEKKILKDTATSSVTNVDRFSGKEEPIGSWSSEMQSKYFSGRSEGVRSKDLSDSVVESKASFDSSEVVSYKDQAASQSLSNASSVRPEDGRWKSQVPSENYIRTKTSIDKSEDLDLINQAASRHQALHRTSSDVTAGAVTKDHLSSLTNFRAPLAEAEIIGSDDRASYEMHSGASFSKVDDVALADETSQIPFAFPGRLENAKFRHQPSNFPRASSSTNVDTGGNSKDKSGPKRQSKDFTRNLLGDFQTKEQVAYQEGGSEGNLLAPQSKWSSFPGTLEHTPKNDLMSSQVQFGGLTSRMDGSSHQESKLQHQSSASEHSHNMRGRRDTTSTHMNGNLLVSHEKVIANSETSACVSTVAVEQVQKARLSKGNQELNDELQIKANDLEKLFAAHKLRVPGDQSATVRRSKPAEVQVEQVTNAVYRKPVEVTPLQFPKKASVREPLGKSNGVLEYNPDLVRMVDSQDHGNVAEVDNVRGKLYNMYVQKRDAKLREEWSSSRIQKEAKMKAMQDYLESSSAELNGKLSGSTDRENSVSNARRRAEKLRSFNIRSAMKVREQHPISFLQSEEDRNLLELPEQTQSVQERLFGETVTGDGSSRSILAKRLSTNKTAYSSTPRTSGSPFSRSSTRPSYQSSERRQTQPENALVQSVPNFSDFRKENTRPSSGISKVTVRSQFRSVRNRSTSEELSLVKEEKPRRSQVTRKSITVPGEMKDTSSLNGEGVVLTSLKSDKDQTEQSLYNKSAKTGESKPFLRKGNGNRASTAKLKASMASENLKVEEETDDLVEDQFEDSVDMIEGEEEEFEAVMGDEMKAVDYLTDSDTGKQGVSKESVESGEPGLENIQLSEPLGPVDCDSVDEVTGVLPSMFHTSSIGHVQDSPGESPASWNSRGHHPFPYTQETSDVDGFVESPMGSPASWNSHSLTQMEADAARMRKKWGSAQKTILVSNVSNHQTRKDVTKGFKRLLKFGRKSRGTESLADWISVTTSEGDDDTEDGSDIANRSSEDLRKSRMGFPHDGFNDGELFNEQVQVLRSSIPTPPANFKLRQEHLSGSSLKAPRSFFSLSSFRSKGSESKPR